MDDLSDETQLLLSREELSVGSVLSGSDVSRQEISAVSLSSLKSGVFDDRHESYTLLERQIRAYQTGVAAPSPRSGCSKPRHNVQIVAAARDSAFRGFRCTNGEVRTCGGRGGGGGTTAETL